MDGADALAHIGHTGNDHRTDVLAARALFLENVERVGPRVLQDLQVGPFDPFNVFARSNSLFAVSFDPRSGYEVQKRMWRDDVFYPEFADLAEDVLKRHHIDAPWMRDQVLVTMAYWLAAPEAQGTSWGPSSTPAFTLPAQDDLYHFRPEPVSGWEPIAFEESSEHFRKRALANLEGQLSDYLLRYQLFLKQQGIELPGRGSSIRAHVRWFVLYQVCGDDVRELQESEHRSKATINAALQNVSELLDIPRRYRQPGRPPKKRYGRI